MAVNEEYVRIPLLQDDNAPDDNQGDHPAVLTPVRRIRSEPGFPSNETTVRIEREAGKSNCSYQSLLPNWVVVFLLSTLLAWIAWMGIKELYARSEEPYDWLHRCKAASSEEKIEMILSDVNRYVWNLADTLHGCPVNFHHLTIRRLRLRVYERQTRLLNHTNVHPSKSQPVRHVIPQMIEVPLGLGNWMFFLASTYGIARDNNMASAIFNESYRETYFPHLSVTKKSKTDLFNTSDPKLIERDHLVVTKGWATYDDRMRSLSQSTNGNLLLSDYLQVYRYFDGYRDDVRKMFLFGPDIFDTAINVIDRLIEDFLKVSRTQLTELPKLIAIHVRRGDILIPHYASLGWVPATEAGLLRATLHMQAQYKPVLFVVVTNDATYCRQVFKEENILFVEHQAEQVDMAILTLMDHIVLSVGSYGWWGAYLSDAKDVLYFENWPRNGSEMDKGFTASDYFLKTWKPYV